MNRPAAPGWTPMRDDGPIEGPIMTDTATETTFDFGAGPVAAHRHVNPDGSVGGWVADTATVDATAHVGADAQVYGNARVSDTAQVYDTARVSGNARVSGDAQVYGEARVFGAAWVYGGIGR